MLVIDNRKSVPLNTSCLDWHNGNIKWLDKNVCVLPLSDPALNETAEYFAYEIAALRPWLFPDLDAVTIEFQIDLWYSFPRYYLRVGTKPGECLNENSGAEFTEFCAQRKKAVQENRGRTAYDSFPVVLTPDEEDTVRRTLYKLGVH